MKVTQAIFPFILISLSGSILSATSVSATPISICLKHFENSEYKQAIAPCTQAAEAGDSSAQTMLGEIYDLDADSENTRYWWSKASESGYQPARNLLALKYFYGGTVLGAEKGWGQDYSKAYKIWHKDAEQGIATSQFMIGVMYQQGLGVEKNLAESYFWLKVALSNGYKLSTDVLIEISRDITPAEKRLGQEKLAKYKQQKQS